MLQPLQARFGVAELLELHVHAIHDRGRVEDWRRCSIGSAYPLLPVSVGLIARLALRLDLDSQ